jgi:hypothetical protein
MQDQGEVRDPPFAWIRLQIGRRVKLLTNQLFAKLDGIAHNVIY